MRILTAVPVYNEQAHVHSVLDSIAPLAEDLLVIDDGSQDATPDLLAQRNDIFNIRHPKNLGYGAALASAFNFALEQGYDALITLDCDGQHQPSFLPRFRESIENADIVSGSRYLQDFAEDSHAPQDRRAINRTITQEINQQLNLQLTDSFCGFKAYSAKAMSSFHITENGYAMPLQLWVQAVAANLKIVELPVPRIYLDEKRSFGGTLDDSKIRLAHYRQALADNIKANGLKPMPSLVEADPATAVSSRCGCY